MTFDVEVKENGQWKWKAGFIRMDDAERRFDDTPSPIRISITEDGEKRVLIQK